MALEDAVSQHWDRKDMDNPLNWPRKKKYLILALVSYIDLLTPFGSMAFAPGIPQMQKELHVHNNTLATLAMTIYVLGFSVGPLIFAPLSEVHGRAIVYKGCLVMFLIATIACAMSSTIYMLLIFRFSAGCLGAAPVAIGGAIVYDLFRVDERGGAIAIYQAGPLLGNLFGPPLGGVIIEHSNWRSVFWFVAVLTVLALICSSFVLKETYAPIVLAQKWVLDQPKNVEPDETTSLDPNHACQQAELRSDLREAVHIEWHTSTTWYQAFRRPVEILFRSPVCAACSLVIILGSGTTNLIFASLGRTFQDQYGFSTSESGLTYLAVTVGFIIAAFVFGSTSDHVSNLLKLRNQGKMEPEFRLPAMVLGLPLVAVGLVWYGWTVQNHVFWIFPLMGLNVVGIGMTTVQLSLQIYVVDSFAEFAASALAATTVTRSIGGALVPLAGPMLYHRFGFGWGNSLLALANLAMCIVPCILFVYGKKWRGGDLAKNM